ncbi:MAG: energy-coupling factor transporter transmembrane protein EcfT [Candidatus Cloacimonetes bacterium]|nr:energy-coupling factor transporter transmembrane protein EcfT [Candidatus Cloacimonadota bacterium]MDD3578768.1 energy-coupling factor transporter transmembrane component T [Candidatus Cloacimonadota bacterium]MDD4034850.1 energy-coupling factor transporter transmembrane component T [Candidatus Cloacimonadota bacterium]
MKRFLHPLSYICLCILYSSLALVIADPTKQLMLLIIAWALDWRGGATVMLDRIRGLGRYLWLFLSVMLIQLLFVREGDLIMKFAFIEIHEQGLQQALIIGMRLAIIYMVANSLSKLDFTLYKAAFSRIGLPEELSFMISYMAHLVPQLNSNFKGQIKELKLRGIQIRKLPLREKLEIYKIISIATVAQIVLSSKTQAIALELRGFRSIGRRSNLHVILFSYRDLFVPLWAVLLIIILL